MTNVPMRSRRRKGPTEGTGQTFGSSPYHRGPHSGHHQSNKPLNRRRQTLQTRIRKRFKLGPTAPRKHRSSWGPISK